MPPFFAYAVLITWSVLLGYWLWSARLTKKKMRQESLWIRIFIYWLPLLVAVFLLGPGPWFGQSFLRDPFVPHSMIVYSLGLELSIFGASLAIYSRFQLGRNWSATVQIKQDHELITHGAYRVIRHPIYTGVLLLFLGNAVMIGDWRGFLAMTIVFASFWRKLCVEELWLAEHFGQSYRNYQVQTKALIPAVL